MKRAYNFNAGPAALPLEVLQEAKAELLDFGGTGMSVMELSHRSREYDAVHAQAEQLLRKLLGIPDDFHVLFVQGGASLQFSMVPLNLLGEGQAANYILTGSWSEKALQEAVKVGETKVGASSKDQQYRYIPRRPIWRSAAMKLMCTLPLTILSTEPSGSSSPRPRKFP